MISLAVREVAERILEHLTRGDGGTSLAAFLNLDVKGLELIMEPAEEDLPLEELRAVYRYWKSLPKTRGVPDVVKVEPDKLLPALGYIMLIDVGQEEDDFRYALYGSKIAEVSGFDMTGKSIWDIPTTSAIQHFFAACYMVARRVRCPLYSVHEAPPSITVSHWHRLILPLGKDGEIRRFLVCNVPLNEGRLR